MARDYKHSGRKAEPGAKRKKPAPKQARGQSPLGVFAAGLIVGALAGAAGVQWYHTRPAPAPAVLSTPDKPAQPPEEKLDFTFYRLLPEMEVVVPEAEEEAVVEGRKPASKPAPATASTEKYLLQVGAFKRYEDADSLKARLAILGIEAKIHRAEIRGETWHRVRVGPFSDRGELRAVRDRLDAQGMQPVLLKMTG